MKRPDGVGVQKRTDPDQCARHFELYARQICAKAQERVAPDTDNGNANRLWVRAARGEELERDK